MKKTDTEWYPYVTAPLWSQKGGKRAIDHRAQARKVRWGYHPALFYPTTIADSHSFVNGNGETFFACSTILMYPFRIPPKPAVFPVFRPALSCYNDVIR